MSADDLVLVASIVGMELLALWCYDTIRAVRLDIEVYRERRLRRINAR